MVKAVVVGATCEVHALLNLLVDVRRFEGAKLVIECRNRVLPHVVGEDEDDVGETL